MLTTDPVTTRHKNKRTRDLLPSLLRWWHPLPQAPGGPADFGDFDDLNDFDDFADVDDFDDVVDLHDLLRSHRLWRFS